MDCAQDAPPSSRGGLDGFQGFLRQKPVGGAFSGCAVGQALSRGSPPQRMGKSGRWPRGPAGGGGGPRQLRPGLDQLPVSPLLLKLVVGQVGVVSTVPWYKQVPGSEVVTHG